MNITYYRLGVPIPEILVRLITSTCILPNKLVILPAQQDREQDNFSVLVEHSD